MSALSDRLCDLALSDEEAAYLAQIAMAAAANVHPGTLSEQVTGANLLQTASRILARYSPNALAYTGFIDYTIGIPCLEHEDYTKLVAEGRSRAAIRGSMSHHEMAPGGPIASELLASRKLSDFVMHSLGNGVRLRPTECYYHYYDCPEHRTEFHIDQTDFSYSLLLVLEHSWRNEPASAFYVVAPGEDPKRIALRPGGGIVFSSSSLLHCRSAPADGERVMTLSFGFGKGEC